MKKTKYSSKKYWDNNIEKFGKFYASISEEEFNSNKLLEFLYKKTILPIENNLMKKRYEITIKFIHKHVRNGMTVADIGCGTGVFSVEMLRRGAKVIAIDYSENALKLTEKLVEKTAPELSKNIKYIRMDIAECKIPDVDIVLVMGVTPYVEDLKLFLGNILPATKKSYFLMLDPNHWANKIRRFAPILNVRHVQFFKKDYVDDLYNYFGHKLINRENFATGYLDTAVKL